MPDVENTVDLCVIGGGAAGYFAALACAEAAPTARVIILERGSKVLSKVKVSGGGRCNVTHACFDTALLVPNYPRGGHALRGPFTRFQPQDTVQWFESRNVRLKTEADGRIFPVSDSSQTIIDCLTRETNRLKIHVRMQSLVEAATLNDKTGNGFVIKLRGGEVISADQVLIATGGDQNGFELARSLGHTIIPPVPSLFTFTISDHRLEGLSGLSVQQAQIRLPDAGLEQVGPVLITHWGLSGPAILKLSAWGARFLFDNSYRAQLIVNWLHPMEEEHVYQVLMDARNKTPRQRVIGQDPTGTLPQRLWRKLAEAAGVKEILPWNGLSKALAFRLASELTRGNFAISGKGAFKDEFVTCGGVNLKEINFKTMESRIVKGLYFAGEVLDIDAITGGFNFQNAWTTGYLAGQAAAQSISSGREEDHQSSIG